MRDYHDQILDDDCGPREAITVHLSEARAELDLLDREIDFRISHSSLDDLAARRDLVEAFTEWLVLKEVVRQAEAAEAN